MSEIHSSPETEHTPTPWEVMGNRGDIKSVCKGFPETMVAKVAGQPTREERAANAAFIVKAVNNHEALVKALEEIVLMDPWCIRADDLGRAVRIANKALGFRSPQATEQPHD